MMPGAKYFLDIPVYRLPEADYYLQRERYIESIFFPEDDPTTAELNRRSKANDPQRWGTRYDIFAKIYGGPWDYNEIIGFIRLHFFGSQIRGDYWSTDAKRIVRTRKKLFKWRTWKLAPEMELPENGTNAEIYETVRKYVQRCAQEIPGRCIFTRDLDVLGPHVDWNGLLQDGSNYGPQPEHSGLVARKRRKH